MLRHADDEAANDVDEKYQQTGNRITTHKLAGTVHGAKKFGFIAHFGAAAFGFFFVDGAGVQIGINGHLFAGHGVQRKARADLCNALGTLGHHNEVDDHDDGEHDQAHRKVAANQEVAKGLDHRTGRTRAGMTFQQHHAGRRHVQRKP